MIVDYSLLYRLTEKINDERKTDLCMKIFSEYENYLQANYARSLIDPNPYRLPEKAPDSSSGLRLRSFSGGKWVKKFLKITTPQQATGHYAIFQDGISNSALGVDTQQAAGYGPKAGINNFLP